MARMLDSQEAARRLGVKVGTLYAYVSRGLLASHPDPASRRSLFDLDEVERLARRSRGGDRPAARLATVATSVTQLRADGPAYRGIPAVELAGRTPYEEVAELLWGDAGEPDAGRPWEPCRLPRRPAMGASDRLRWAVVLAGAADPLRADLRPEAVVRTARRLVATAVAALPGDGPDTGPVAARLAARLADGPPRPAFVAAVDAALVLLADHELATSTVAVRVAASTRADLCDAVLAGLGTIAGPLHGGASQLAYALLVEAERVGAGPALDDTLRWQGQLPGFGHPVYVEGDPRFTVLRDRFEAAATPAQRRLVAEVVDVAADHGIPPPNVDLALGALTWSAGLPADTGRTLFTVARLAGWTAHYLEELDERPLRFRARAVYASEGD